MKSAHHSIQENKCQTSCPQYTIYEERTYAMPTFESESSPPCDMMLIDRVKILLAQERSKAYATSNYLRHLDVESVPKPVNESCRVKMAEWIATLCDICRLSRSVVATTFSYVDKILSDTNNGEETMDVLRDREKYQLVVIVCFYIAVKINEQKVLSPYILERLSRGRYTVQDIENEEQRILQVLDWRLFGPNAYHFVHHFLEMISPARTTGSTANGNTCAPPAINEVVRRALVQVESSLSNQSFVDHNYSDIALAALRNAIDDVGYVYCPHQVWAANLDVCNILVGIDAYSDRVEYLKERLREMMVDCSGRSHKSFSSKSQNVKKLSQTLADEEIMTKPTKPPRKIKKRDIPVSSPTCVGSLAIES